MKKTLAYGFFFMLGASYLMLFGGQLNWPHPILFVAIGAWGVLLTSVAWWRYRHAQAVSETLHTRYSTVLAEFFPALGLMISAIGSAVELEYIFRGLGRWWVGLLWVAAVAAFIVAARHSRRTTIIVALRGVVALFVIDAIVQRTAAALATAGLCGLTLLLLEKFWHGDSASREVPFWGNR